MLSVITSTIAAMSCIMAGVVLLPLPIPLGAPLIAIGTGIAIISNPWARKSILNWRRRNPHGEKVIERLKNILPIKLHKPIDLTDPGKDKLIDDKYQE